MRETSLDLPSDIQSHWTSELWNSDYFNWDCNENWLWWSGILTRSFFLIGTFIIKLVPVISLEKNWLKDSVNKIYFSLSDKDTSSILQRALHKMLTKDPASSYDDNQHHKLCSCLTLQSHKDGPWIPAVFWYKVVCAQPQWLGFTLPNPYHLKVRWG